MGFLGSVIILRSATTDDISTIYPIVGIMLMISSFADLGVSTTFVKLGSSLSYDPQEKFKTLFNTTLAIKISLALAAALLCFLFSHQISLKTFNSGNYSTYIKWISLGIMFNSLGSFYFSYLQVKNKISSIVWIKVLPSVIKIILIAFFSYTKQLNINNLIVIFLSTPVLQILMYLLFLVPFQEYALNTYNRKTASEVFRYSKWIATTGMIVSLLGQTDTLMLRSLTDAEAVKILVGGQKLASPFPIITITIVTILLPKVSSMKTFAELNYLFRKSFLVVPIIAVLALLTVIISPTLIDFILGFKYSPSSTVFQYYAIGALLSLYITPVSTILYKLNKEHMFLLLNVIQLFINIGLNYLLIPHLAADGAALATFGTKVFGLVFILIVLFNSGIMNKEKFSLEV